MNRAARAERAYLRYVLWACSACAGSLTFGLGLALDKMTALMVAGGVLFAFGFTMTVRAGAQYVRLSRNR